MFMKGLRLFCTVDVGGTAGGAPAGNHVDLDRCPSRATAISVQRARAIFLDEKPCDEASGGSSVLAVWDLRHSPAVDLR